MKKILLILILVKIGVISKAQHQISFNAGWTASKIVEFTKTGASLGGAYHDLHKFPIHHAIYGAIEYEYTLYPLKLSVGLSASEFGTSKYALGPWTMYYSSIPVMIGYQWKLPKDFSFTLEGGVEIGLETSSTVATNHKWSMLALGTIGLEASWKRLKFGLKGHFSLNPFRDWKTAYLHHSGITTYIGYTLFDSVQHKKRRAKRLEKKKSKISANS